MSWEDLQDVRGSRGAVSESLNLLHIITKPVVDRAFLQDWLSFLSLEQGFKVQLLYAPQAFEDDLPTPMSTEFPSIELHRIEKVSPHSASRQGIVFLADYLDLRYLSRSSQPTLVHTHDTRSLLLARYFYSTCPRLHSWWLDDRSAHRLWRVTVERLATWRTWETIGEEGHPDHANTRMAQLAANQFPLPTPHTFEGPYRRGPAFATMREIYRSILRTTNFPARS